MDKLSDKLYIGDAFDASDRTTVKLAGIGAVMNLTEYLDAPIDGVEYHTLGQEDCEPIPPERIDTFIRVMEEWERRGHTVLIHCAAGISRAPSFTIAWLIHEHERAVGGGNDVAKLWDAYEAFIRSRRSIIQPHPILKESVLAYFAPKEAK